jgi:hypothetical protein
MVKFKSAAQAQRSRENAASWAALLKRYEVASKVTPAKVPFPSYSNYRKQEIPSLDTGIGDCFRAPDQVYTGSMMVGIGQLHKSNAVPVFKKSDAIDIAKMRRG